MNGGKLDKYTIVMERPTFIKIQVAGIIQKFKMNKSHTHTAWAQTYTAIAVKPHACEPVWPSGKALGWLAEGPRFDPIRLSFLFKYCGLWRLSCDFAHTVNETLKWLTQLPTLM